jgi:UDP-N-acetylmuramoyl-tripeptide--D-alanyl-D-alanine ligase
MRWTPEELARDAGGKLLRAGPTAIEAAFIDSRSPRAGALFVPIVAARDGHDFIPHAIAGGAAAVLIQNGRPLPEGDCTVVEVADTLEGLTELARSARRRRLEAGVPAVAITGSNGKTTTRAMVEAVFRAGFNEVLSTRGNFNNHLGVPLSLLDAPHEPDAEVLELGMSAPGENDHLASIVQPRIGIVTSVALEHLEFMGSIEAIAKAEAEVMGHVADDGALVIPSDEPLLVAELPADYRPRVWKVGPDAGADIRIDEVELRERTHCRFTLPGGRSMELALGVFGVHNARNAASAIAVGLHLGLEPEVIAGALEAVEPVGDRGRLRQHGKHLIIADCYNANPGSMEVALQSLAKLRDTRRGRLVAVLGDMLELGPTQAQLHREVGERAAALGIDALLAFGPLSEDIARGAENAGVGSVEWIAEVGDDAAVQRAREWVDGQLGSEHPGAALFKASRGIRLERVIDSLGAS